MRAYSLFWGMFLLALPLTSCGGFKINGSDPVAFRYEGDSELVGTALSIFGSDMEAVFGFSPQRTDADADIVVVNLEEEEDARFGDIAGKREAFSLSVDADGVLWIAGSDAHGTAYGILELSRMIGVSPWEWWADSSPRPLKRFSLPAGYTDTQFPSVEYRGIFINDEDWGLTPWSWQNFEPSDIKGQVGPRTHERIFELLLRLRANTFWPAMHSCSVPFYLTDGNRETAERYGIHIGTSHCEPMMRNTNGEWHVAGVGDYDWVHNRDNVLQFWRDRVTEVSGGDCFYTLGMRGIHDGPMTGVSSIEEMRDALQNIIGDQRQILEELVNKDVTKVPQMFIPYKEVLQAYNMGMDVPDDVTLMWCDDNYGFIRHFPTEAEAARAGGNGVYYHISYWGRPHDYLWLSSTHPALIRQQMGLAYERGIRKIWIFNVGDIKPGEYLLEYCMDLAWDFQGTSSMTLDEHLGAFLSREFGKSTARKVLPAMLEYYRLCLMRKPEFMAHTRTEEADFSYTVASDLPWDLQTLTSFRDSFADIARTVAEAESGIAPDRSETYFELVSYPVRSAALMAQKHIAATLARHSLGSWEDSDSAFDSIVSLTDRYNAMPKWKGIITYCPRNLTVYAKVSRSESDSELPLTDGLRCLLNGAEATSGAAEPLDRLGYMEKAASIAKGKSATYSFSIDSDADAEIELCMLPGHPVVAEDGMAVGISVDGGAMSDLDYQTYDRSEEWKENVLSNHAVRSVAAHLEKGMHTITVTALSDGVVLDQIRIR